MKFHSLNQLESIKSGKSMVTPILKVFSLFSTHLKPINSTLPGTGFAKNFWIIAEVSSVSRYTKMVRCLSGVSIKSDMSISYFPYCTSHRNYQEG